jgi:hypothetical protein
MLILEDYNSSDGTQMRQINTGYLSVKILRFFRVISVLSFRLALEFAKKSLYNHTTIYPPITLAFI